LDLKFLSWNARHEPVRKFAKQYGSLATGKKLTILEDFVKISPKEFDTKYIPDEES
jgi:hypothetical protein